MVIAGRNAGGLQGFRICLALVAQRIEPGGCDHRRREPGEAFGAQRRHAPVGAMGAIGEGGLTGLKTYTDDKASVN